jgi:hypothetical protein
MVTHRLSAFRGIFRWSCARNVSASLDSSLVFDFSMQLDSAAFIVHLTGLTGPTALFQPGRPRGIGELK